MEIIRFFLYAVSLAFAICGFVDGFVHGNSLTHTAEFFLAFSAVFAFISSRA